MYCMLQPLPYLNYNNYYTSLVSFIQQALSLLLLWLALYSKPCPCYCCINLLTPNRLRFPGFNLRVVCFNPNLQDLEGCEATPIDQLFSGGRRRRSSAPSEPVEWRDTAKGEELLAQFIRDISGSEEQVGIYTLVVQRVKQIQTFSGTSNQLITCWES